MKYIICIILFMSLGIVASAQVNPKILKADNEQQILWSVDLTGADTYWGFHPFSLLSILTDTLGWVGTDSQTLAIDSNATTYTMSISGGNAVDFAKGNGTDDQTIDVFTFTNPNINLSLEGDGEATKSIDISAIDTDTQLSQEQVEDYVGAMVTGNTETLITVSYQDIDGTIDYVVDNNLANYSNATSGFLTTEVDGSTTNELQTLSFTNPSLSISSGNSVSLAALSDGNGIYDGSGSVGSGETQVTAGPGSFMVFDATGSAGSGTWGSFEVEINGTDALNINAASNNVAIDGTTLVVETDTDLVGINHSSGSPPTQKLDVNGNVRIRGDVYDSNNSSGADSYVLSQDAGGITWERSATPFIQIDVTPSNVQTINSNNIKITGFGAEIDPSSLYTFSGTTDVITVVEAGYYEISVGIEIGGSSSPSGPSIEIANSSGTAYKTFSINPSTNEQWMEFTHVEQLSASGTIAIYANNGGSGSFTTDYAKVIVKRISK